MEKSKEDIIQTTINHDDYYWSTLEKENDSGILFNQRIFFLQSQKAFGYISDPKSGLTGKSIEKPKALVPIDRIKSVMVSEKDLVVKFVVDENNRKLERTWLLRASSQALAKKWQDKLKFEKNRDIINKTPPKLLEQESQFRKTGGVRDSSIPRRKNLSFSKTIQVSANPQVQKHSQEVGVSPEPTEQLQPIKPFKLIETRQYGTMVSQKSQVYPSTQQIEKQVRDANIGTEGIPQEESPLYKSNYQRQPTEIQHPPQTVSSKSLHKQPQPIKSFHGSIKHQDRSSQEEPQQIKEKSKSDRRSGNIKAIRSQPSGNKVEPHQYPTNKSQYVTELVEPVQAKNEPQDFYTNKAQKNPSVVSVPEPQIMITRSKTQSQIVVQPNKQQSRQQQYYERTSKLIKKSSIAQRTPNRPPQEEKALLSHNENSTPGSFAPTQQIRPIQQQPEGCFQSQAKSPTFQAQTEPKPQSQSQPLAQPQHHQSVRKSETYPEIIEQIDSVVDSLEHIPWTFKYIKYREHIFKQFVEYTEDLLRQLLKDLSFPTAKRFYSPKFIRNGIRYYQINDVEVKIAFIELIKPHAAGWNEREKICSKQSIKILQNQYNNYQALYEYLGAESRLKVPLVCLNQINGTLALFKALSIGLEQPIKVRQLESQLASLKGISKIDHNFYHNSQKYLVHLNSRYYNKFKVPQNEYDRHISFDIVLIQELEGFLLQDLVTDKDDGQNSLLRKQLVQLYAEKQMRSEKEEKLGPDQSLQKGQSKGQLATFGQNIFKAISTAIKELDSLQVYFFNSKDLARYLHSNGINIRYLGYIYSYLQTGFQKQMVMSELAARTCKTLFRKTIQDLTIEEYPSPQEFNTKVCDFLNCVLGSTYQTAAIWKLLSTHCKHYFGVDINFEQIQKGYFLISLVQNCRLDVVWQRLVPEEVFRSNFFFSQRNLKGLKPSHKIYPPFYNQQFQNTINIVLKEQNQEGFQSLLTDLFLDSSPLPQILAPIADDVNKYLAYFVNPTKPSLPHLHIYHPIITLEPSRVSFDIGLIEIKWLLKLKIKDKYIKACDQLIQKATKFYGQYHPIFSELYDIFSAYHGSHGEFEDAITFAKSSLVNTLSLCGTHHQKTSECYYFLGLYYLQATRAEQALHNFKKAKKILEHNNTTKSMSYAANLAKLALIHLNQGQNQLCLTYSEEALRVLEGLEAQKYEDELTECFEMMTRCYEVERNTRKLRQISQRIGSKLNTVASRSNLQKMLKMYIYPILADLSSQSASSYLDIIAQLPKQINPHTEDLAFGLIQERIAEGNFELSLYQYFRRINSIEEYIGQADILKGWASFKHRYQRQTVNDFVSLTEQLLVFLGEGFLTGALRQAL